MKIMKNFLTIFCGCLIYISKSAGYGLRSINTGVESVAKASASASASASSYIINNERFSQRDGISGGLLNSNRQESGDCKTTHCAGGQRLRNGIADRSRNQNGGDFTFIRGLESSTKSDINNFDGILVAGNEYESFPTAKYSNDEINYHKNIASSGTLVPDNINIAKYSTGQILNNENLVPSNRRYNNRRIPAQSINGCEGNVRTNCIGKKTDTPVNVGRNIFLSNALSSADSRVFTNTGNSFNRLNMNVNRSKSPIFEAPKYENEGLRSSEITRHNGPNNFRISEGNKFSGTIIESASPSKVFNGRGSTRYENESNRHERGNYYGENYKFSCGTCDNSGIRNRKEGEIKGHNVLNGVSASASATASASASAHISQYYSR